jgi:hypothetical protein
LQAETKDTAKELRTTRKKDCQQLQQNSMSGARQHDGCGSSRTEQKSKPEEMLRRALPSKLNRGSQNNALPLTHNKKHPRRQQRANGGVRDNGLYVRERKQENCWNVTAHSNDNIGGGFEFNEQANNARSWPVWVPLARNK